MTSAQYAVIRIIADPARDEPMNVGVLLWSHSEYRLTIDKEAISQVLRRNPHLANDALAFVDDFLRTGIQEHFPNQARELEESVRNLSVWPVSITEPRYVSLTDRSSSTLDTKLAHLIRRLVHPPKLHGGRRSLRDEVRKRLKPFVERELLKESYAFASSHSGSQWTVDYFANSGTNVAVDVLPLAIQNADIILNRAAAEAFKLQDVVPEVPVTFKIICQFSEDERFADANRRAQNLLEAVGAEVQSDLDQVVDDIRSRLPLALELSGQANVVPFR